MKKRGSFAFKTDIGKVRTTNEDQVVALLNRHQDILLAVADGMGGHARGDLASRLAMASLTKGFKNTFGLLTSKTATLWLRQQVVQANRAIYQEAQKSSSLKEMGTTLVIALVVNKDLIILNIGDSRVYLYQNNTLTQATEDQTYVEYLFRQGKITEAQKATHPQRHVLLNALGLNTSVSYDVKIVPYTGQTIVACSDGLYNNLTEGELLTIIRSSDTPQQKIDSLINLANANGGTDNIAVALWEAEK
ncbi:MAG: Stp1/IreP family PP2C-type Ser/Thr phosphatase [Bacilli bacterium]